MCIMRAADHETADLQVTCVCVFCKSAGASLFRARLRVSGQQCNYQNCIRSTSLPYLRKRKLWVWKATESEGETFHPLLTAPLKPLGEFLLTAVKTLSKSERGL